MQHKKKNIYDSYIKEMISNEKEVSKRRFEANDPFRKIMVLAGLSGVIKEKQESNIYDLYKRCTTINRILLAICQLSACIMSFTFIDVLVHYSAAMGIATAVLLGISLVTGLLLQRNLNRIE